VGDRVEYNSRSKGAWLPATIVRLRRDGTVCVRVCVRVCVPSPPLCAPLCLVASLDVSLLCLCTGTVAIELDDGRYEGHMSPRYSRPLAHFVLSLYLSLCLPFLFPLCARARTCVPACVRVCLSGGVYVCEQLRTSAGVGGLQR
jgi:hypothetical protein